jgi:hypothetical protein
LRCCWEALLQALGGGSSSRHFNKHLGNAARSLTVTASSCPSAKGNAPSTNAQCQGQQQKQQQQQQ